MESENCGDYWIFQTGSNRQAARIDIYCASTSKVCTGSYDECAERRREIEL
jgi:hypothetical protein